MKPLRITVVLLSLLVLPLLGTQALANFTATLYDVPNTIIGANTVNKPVIGFIIPAGESGNILDRVKVRSYIERVYSVGRLKLWVQNDDTVGFSGGDLLLKTVVTSPLEFDIGESTAFLGINRTLSGADTFYITVDVYTSAVLANPDYYHQKGVDVTLEAGDIRLTNGEINDAPVVNPDWSGYPPPYYDVYTLVFDTHGPDFDLHFCIEDNTCSTYTYYGSGWTRLLNVDQEDSLRICATNVEGDIDTAEGIHIIGKVHLVGPVSSLHMFGVADIMLTCPDVDEYGCGGGDKNGCDTCWTTGFRIPDAKNVGGFDGVDADSGHWAICAWAKDSVGNIDTVCLEHGELPYRIDTQKPKLDSITWELVNDWNGDGNIGLGDCIMIIGWGLSNAWEPVFECAKMEVDTSWMSGNPGPEWAELNDILEHNRIFRRVFCLTTPVAIDSTDCPVSFLVKAWDNACNYDTMTGQICGTMDLDPPVLDVLYEWHTDYDVEWGCLGLGDKAKITAMVGGSDIVSVTAMMDSAGIDTLMRHAVPLPFRGLGVYDTVWTITEPPILYGKDADNRQPPLNDNDYSITVIACDDVGNCDTASGTLNKTLDTRRPRPIGFACPDSVPCALTAQSLAGGIISLTWDTACDESDGFYYYIWASFNGAPFESLGATNVAEQNPTSKYYTWNSEPLAEGYWQFKIKTEDNCSNVGPFSCVVGAFADTTPPHVCIAVPDSGLTFGSWFPLKAVADSESHDVESACLWYRIRPDIENPAQDPGGWTPCPGTPCMYRFDDGIVFLDSVWCLEAIDYTGWVEMIVVACDEVGNCQDTTSAWEDACLVDNDVFRPGRFFFYWDTASPALHLVSVNGFPSPQSACGFDVNPDSMNMVVIDVEGATAADSFEVEVRALGTGIENRIFHQDFMTMPCTIWVSVDGWPQGTQDIYIYVKNYDNDKTSNLQVELCIPPPPPEHCIYIDWPHEWMRIPCTGTSGYNCVEITADVYDHYKCAGVNFTEVRFQWSPNGIDSWETIADVIEPDKDGGWSTCWDNTGKVENGDTVYFRVIAHDEFYMADTSNMVKVFVDCEQPAVKIKIEEVVTTCNGISKVSCAPLTLKAVLEDTLIDIDRIRFFFKRHSAPDIHEYWIPIDGWAQPAWSDNIWMYQWETPCCEVDDFGVGGGQLQDDCMYPNDYWDIRIAARDIAGLYMFDYDNDGFFDDSTFNDALAFGAGVTVYLDNEAPQPAISKVCDQGHEPPICIVNPSDWLDGTGKAYVQAGHDITAEISVLPSEDTCDVMKVEWFLCTLEEREPITSPPMGSSGVIGSGDDCGSPIEVNLPGDFPYQNNNTTCGKGNDYGYNVGQPTCLRPYDWAQDIIYQLNVTKPVYATIILDPPANSYAGMLLTTECPPTEDNCIDKAYWWIFGVPHGFYNVLLVPGTYYIMIDNFIVNPSFPTCIQDFTLYISGEEIEDMPCVHLGTSTDPYHFPVTFNPLTSGLIEPYLLEDGWWKGYLRAELYDSLGNHKKDLIELYILDITPSQAVIVDPLNESYVSGDVDLSVMALNKYHIAKVCYEYKPEGGTEWLPINGGYPNACISSSCDTVYTEFDHVWHTFNTVPDGVYYLRAVATDCDNNVDDDPHTIKVTVNNQLPTAVIENPGTCPRPCSNNPEDTLLYVSGTVTLYATASSPTEIPIDHVAFMYKSIFGYPNTWQTIGTDYFPTDGKYSVEWTTPVDGRYELKAVAYDASGKHGDSEPVVVSVDNSGPFSQIVSIMGEPVPPTSIDITRGAVIDIELWAMDSTSSEGWTRCYNSGLTSIQVCIERCNDETHDTTELTKCFEVTPATDGFHTVQWNTSGLEFEGCSGCYYLYVKATDCLGNIAYSTKITVYVSDIIPPVTTIGGFDGNYIYGYSSEKVQTLLFEYADSGSTDWTSIGWSSYIDWASDDGLWDAGYYLYKTSWDPAKTFTVDGVFQVRVISHDTCSNQDDSLAPVTYIHVTDGIITPYDPGVLGGMNFEKNWCVGGMHGLVRETSTEGVPAVFVRIGSSHYDYVHMQLQNPTEYAGSFDADEIDDGGTAKFFSSVTVSMGEGEPAYVTYLGEGSFDVVQVKRDLVTHVTSQDGCVEVTIPAGAVGDASTYDRYIWVSPTMMPWVPPTQPDLKPIGDNNGFATYVSFTDCYYCCGWWTSKFGGDQGNIAKSPSDGYGDCCFNPGRWAKIKMCYDTLVTTDKAHLAVVWWDCEDGEFKFDNIIDPVFNTTNHTVEFGTTCLSGPFAVVERIERPCDGTVVVSMREQDIEPYCNGYTNPTPKFTSLITDNVEGPSGIDRHSIQFKVDLFTPGQLIRIYNGEKYDDCHKWATGFGSFEGSGYDKVSGLFRAGWNDSTYLHSQGDNDEWESCDLCYQEYFGSDYLTWCKPMYPLSEGAHIATVTAMNDHIQTCTDTAHIMVDATKPWMAFADSIGAYVGKNPHFCMYFNDALSGVDKGSIWIDLFGDDYSDPSPNNHDYIATVHPDQLEWVNDTTVCFNFTFENSYGGYLHIYVYGGPEWKCSASCPNTQYYGYTGGIADCVGNRLGAFWQYYTVDAYGPTITNAYNTLCDPVLKFQIMDDMAGVGNVYVYEDGTLKSLIEQDPWNPSYWYYTPSAGPHHVDIKAYDKLGNFTVKSFDVTGDCAGPTVSFVPSFISCKTPTVRIVVTDPSGVKWDSLKVDLYTSDWVLQTFVPGMYTRNGDTITVVGDGDQFGLSDGSVLYAVVYTEKTGATSYSRGPEDSVGNATASQWIKKAYYADCVGPTITWKYGSSTALPKECERPVKLMVTDAKSGVATVMLYDNKVDKTSSLVYNASSGWWEYTPTAGKHTLDVIATDLMGNSTTYTFDVKDDCLGPAVACGDGNYVTKDPHVKFTVTDPSGVDWSTVNARVYGCGKECIYLAPELYKHVNLSTGEVTLDCILDCSDGSVVDVYVYSGTSYTGLGPADLLGNYTNYTRCSYVVDAGKPTITVINTSIRPIEICITDAKSGIDWSTLEFYEDSVLICQGLACTDTNVHLDTDKGCMFYEPSAGRKHVEIRVKDNAGNWVIYSFYTEDENLVFTDPHNYPNPFDPRELSTYIDLGLSKSAYVTVKIYDFAGEFVRELQKDKWTGTSTPLKWDGKTDEGTEVGNGTYLCYIHARDDSGATKTAVIKITVLKKDK